MKITNFNTTLIFCSLSMILFVILVCFFYRRNQNREGFMGPLDGIIASFSSISQYFSPLTYVSSIAGRVQQQASAKMSKIAAMKNELSRVKDTQRAALTAKINQAKTQAKIAQTQAKIAAAKAETAAKLSAQNAVNKASSQVLQLQSKAGQQVNSLEKKASDRITNGLQKFQYAQSKGMTMIFAAWVAGNAKCLLSTYKNLNVCWFWYLLNMIAEIVYVPISFILWCIPPLVPIKKSFVSILESMDSVIFNVIGYHIIHFPCSINKKCFSCEYKFMPNLSFIPKGIPNPEKLKEDAEKILKPVKKILESVPKLPNVPF